MSLMYCCHFLQFCFAGYTLSLICRKGPEDYLYLSPRHMIPRVVYVLYIIANCGNIAWIFLWDREFIVASGVVIALLAFCLLLAVGFSMWGLSVAQPELEASKSIKKEIWLNRILVQNALDIYATWVSIATLLNLAMILVYVFGVPEEDASTISLGILAAELVIYFIMDMFIFYTYYIHCYMLLSLKDMCIFFSFTTIPVAITIWWLDVSLRPGTRVKWLLKFGLSWP